MTEEELVEKTIEAIAKDLREFLTASKPVNIEQVKKAIMETFHGVTNVVQDPDNPNCVIISHTPPKMLRFDFVLEDCPKLAP